MPQSYYDIAREGSLDKTHPVYANIQKLSRGARKILDLGCGEGTRLAQIKNKKALKVGVDVSREAIFLAKKNYPNFKFIKVGEKLPFKDGSFDLVYSAFVLEHTRNPENLLEEALRVMADNGKILLVAPNFGAPNRASPNNNTNRISKLFRGIANDLYLLFFPGNKSLEWQKVVPKKTYEFIDADTTCEPYLLSLEKFLVSRNVKILEKSSLWNQESGKPLSQLPFRLLGQTGLPPFSYWGPHLLLIGLKI